MRWPFFIARTSFPVLSKWRSWEVFGEKDGKWIRGVPYQVFGGTEFYERSEIKDMIAYLKVISNPLDQEALLRIVNVPRRGISDACLDILTQYNRQNNISLWKPSCK